MRKTVLVVDDEPVMSLTVSTFLEMEGFTAETAASAEEGIAKLAEHAFDMVITDLKMESAGAGYDVVNAAKSMPYHPVVFIMTAFPDAGLKGADGLLHKPFRLDSLIQQFEAIQNQRHSAAH